MERTQREEKNKALTKMGLCYSGNGKERKIRDPKTERDP